MPGPTAASATQCVAEDDGLSVASLLSELEITQYSAAFVSAGIDDQRLCDIRRQGPDAIEELIAVTSLRGGSATKVRRKLR